MDKCTTQRLRHTEAQQTPMGGEGLRSRQEHPPVPSRKIRLHLSHALCLPEKLTYFHWLFIIVELVIPNQTANAQDFVIL